MLLTSAFHLFRIPSARTMLWQLATLEPGPVKKREDGKPNTGIMLPRETFDGGLPEEGLVAWYETHLADDFTAVFDGGKVTLDKASYLDLTRRPSQIQGFCLHADWTDRVCGFANYCDLKLGTSAGADVDPETATVYFQSGTKPLLNHEAQGRAEVGRQGLPHEQSSPGKAVRARPEPPSDAWHL